jgi:hypothetical protein
LRTIGEPEILATWLDILRYTYSRQDAEGKEVCKVLLSYRSHSRYGHCKLLMLVSGREATEATITILDKANLHRIKNAPQWDMVLSIWQPIASSTRYPSATRAEPHLLLEPPHSHPFDFVSKVVAGSLRQSVYRPTTRERSSAASDRYSGTRFFCVDRTWPPHEHRKEAWLETVENRVLLRGGDSYFMPSDLIHDVEMDMAVAEPRLNERRTGPMWRILLEDRQ